MVALETPVCEFGLPARDFSLPGVDGKTWTTYTVQEGLPGNHVFMLSKSHTGKLWVGTNKGLASMDPSKSAEFKTLTMADGLYANNVFSLTEASDR